MIKRMTASAVALAALPGLAACGGGGGGDEDKVRDLVSLGNKHDPAVCDKVTDRWLKQVTGGSRADCKKQVKGDKSTVKVEKVSVKGDRATVSISSGRNRGQILAVKDGGEWKLDDVKQTPSSSSSSGSSSASGEEVKVRGTYLAFVQAANKEDETVFCGLMSDRYAARLIGKSGSRFPVAECLDAYKRFDFSRLQRALKKVRVTGVSVTGGSAQVKLSDSESVVMKKQKGRWVIDNIGRS